MDQHSAIAEQRHGYKADHAGRVGAALALLHSSKSQFSSAVDWFERSARLFASACDECGRAEVLDDYADFLWQGAEPTDRTRGRRRDTCPPAQRRPATHLSYHPHAATVVGRIPREDVSPFSVLHQATALLDLRDRPYAMALETFELLRRLPGMRTCAVVWRATDQLPDILRAAGDYTDAEAMLLEDATPERLQIGRWRDADLEVLADTGDDIAARSAVAAVKRVLAAAAALEKAEQEQRERAALWPVEEGGTTAAGVFASQAMTTLLATARKVASSSATVLITGESGAGKEVIARAIHEASPQADKVFVPFNCTAVPRDMLDSQLFGYRRGAFTGAATHFPGIIRSAAGGTLLLDEIGEIGLDLQPKLLRFLDTHEIHPLGEPQPMRVDVRIIAATNANLEDLVAAGRFREDLYYRLNVVRLRVPPLRERREEIPVLAHHFLEQFAAESRKENVRLSEEAVEYLVLYSWPGNVRELVNQMRRLAALAENGAVIMPEHLAPEITAARRTVPASERTLSPSELVVRLDQPLAAAVRHLERAMVPYAVETAKGHMEVAARMLGLSRKGLYLKRQRLGLEIGEPVGGEAGLE
ncbi:MAG: sigma-54 interaction domain-containing protein [Bacteroidales bacterium]